MTLFYEDLRVGRSFTSRLASFHQVDVDKFARLTGDLNRLHTDEGYARSTIFGGRVAHGLLVLSLALGLWYEMGLTRNSLLALLGINNVAFKAPVRVGDKIHLASAVVSRRSSDSRPDAGIVTLHDVVANEKGEPLLKFERVLLVKKRGRKR